MVDSLDLMTPVRRSEVERGVNLVLKARSPVSARNQLQLFKPTRRVSDQNFGYFEISQITLP
jgi:hypothetical protein